MWGRSVESTPSAEQQWREGGVGYSWMVVLRSLHRRNGTCAAERQVSSDRIFLHSLCLFVSRACVFEKARRSQTLKKISNNLLSLSIRASNLRS